MNKNIIIVLVGGFFIAVLVAMVVSSGLKKDGGKVAEVKTVKVMVASALIYAGDELTVTNVKWKKWPIDSVISGSIKKKKDKNLEEMVGGRVKYQIEKGLPILKTQLVEGDSSSMLSATLSPGMRAVGISVKAWSMAGGFINPGDKVDVILTYQVKVRGMNDNPEIQSTINKYASETILENIKVLAIDQRSKNTDDTKGKIKVGKTVTLEVDGAGAEKLFLARSMGEMSLALRGAGDNALKKKDQLTTDVQVSGVMQEIARIQGQTAPSANVVRIYNGESVSNVPVRNIISRDQ